MNVIDILVLAIVAAILVSIVLYIRRAKKKGMQCIGCPDSAKCAGNCSGSCGSCSGCHHAPKA